MLRHAAREAARWLSPLLLCRAIQGESLAVVYFAFLYMENTTEIVQK